MAQAKPAGATPPATPQIMAPNKFMSRQKQDQHANDSRIPIRHCMRNRVTGWQRYYCARARTSQRRQK
jgi:hypothetical protein